MAFHYHPYGSLTNARDNQKPKCCSFSPFNGMVSHFQFVDDKMLSIVASLKEARVFKLILDTFLLAFDGQLDSKSKSFFFHTYVVVQRHISRSLGFYIGSLPSLYLDIHLIENMGRNLFAKLNFQVPLPHKCKNLCTL